MSSNSPNKSSIGALVDSKELNKGIIEAFPGGLVHVAIDGAIQTANAEALRILGLSYDELTDRYTQDFAPETIWEDGSPCPPEDYPVTRALMTGEAQPPATIGVRTPSGEISWSIFTAVPVKSPDGVETTGAVVTFLDVTASKATELALRASEASLRSVVDSAPSTIITTTPEGRVLFINRSSIPEYSVDALIGMDIFDFVEPVHADTVRNCMSYVLRTGEVSGYELAGRRGIKGMEGKTHSVRLGPILDEGKVTGLCFVAADVTETKQLQERVALSDRLASIGTLATGVAHEINNPLTYLLLSLELAARSGGPTKAADRWKTSIEGASDAAQRIRKIVDDMAAFGRNGSEELQPVDLEATMESTIKLAEVQTRYRARLIRDYAPTPPVFADSARLSQVFLNFLVNAAQAIDEGDVENNCITIRVRPADGEMAIVEFSDTGCGIADELLPRIFEPFVTTKDVGQGTGLGLHICHNIVTSFAGSLQVKSELGVGSTFTLSLPIAKDVVASTALPTKEPQEAARELRILIIDDEPDIAEAMQMLLTGHHVTLAASGREALPLLKASQFDIIFCDLIMPDMTGIDVFNFIVEERPELVNALVFMTGGAFTERARAFLEKCEQPVLAKPFTYEQVLHFVKERAASS